MGERKTKEELDKLCKKYNVPFLWSWSRYNQYKTDKYSYLLKYIMHEPEDRRDSIYAVSGGYCHDIIENYYNGVITREQMSEEYDDSLLTMNIAEYKYDRNDEDKNAVIADKYESCIKHFFKNHIKPEGIEMLTEMFIAIKVADGIVFQGYIDNCGIITDNGKKKIIITDYKTSTIYKGEKLDKESGQLYLYAEGIRQKTKLPLSDIQIRYLFLKYVNVKYQMANGNWKERQIERNQIGAKLASTAKMWLTKLGYDTENYLDDMITFNSIDNLPEDVKAKIIIEDCYVYLDLTEEKIADLKQDIIEVVTEINAKSEEYDKTKDDHVFWSEVNAKNEYYLGVLSGYSRAKHKPYDEYLQEQEMYHTEDDTDDLLSAIYEME